MIGVYASFTVKEGKEQEVEALISQFEQESRTHVGCISYQCGKVSGSERDYAFIERWASQQDLDAHLAHPFFVENAPTLVALTDGLDIKVVNFER